MTNEEAITTLGDRNNLLWGMSKEEQKYYSEALDMAISALSENKGEWLDDVKAEIDRLPLGLLAGYLDKDDVMQILDNIGKAESE